MSICLVMYRIVVPEGNRKVYLLPLFPSNGGIAFVQDTVANVVKDIEDDWVRFSKTNPQLAVMISLVNDRSVFVLPTRLLPKGKFVEETLYKLGLLSSETYQTHSVSFLGQKKFVAAIADGFLAEKYYTQGVKPKMEIPDVTESERPSGEAEVQARELRPDAGTGEEG